VKTSKERTLTDPVKQSRDLCSVFFELCPASKQHAELWRRLFTAQWLEVIELGRLANVGATTGRGVAYLLAERYRRNRNNRKKPIRELLRYTDLMEEEMERGRNLRSELEPLAVEWGIGPLNRMDAEEVKSTRRVGRAAQFAHAHAREGGNKSELLPAVIEQHISLSAADPQSRSYALRARAERARSEYPPPVLDPSYRGQSSIGLAPPEERAEWVRWIDELSQSWAGPLTATDLQIISGAPARWCLAMLNEWRAHLAQGLSMDQRRATVLSLAREAEAIAREALALHATAEDERARGGALKLALDALDRRARIVGADKVELERPQQTTAPSWEAHASELGLDDADLRAVADIASRAMSRNDKREQE